MAERIAAWCNRFRFALNLTPAVVYDPEFQALRDILGTLTDAGFSAESHLCLHTALNGSTIEFVSAKVGVVSASVPESELLAANEGVRRHLGLHDTLTRYGAA